MRVCMCRYRLYARRDVHCSGMACKGMSHISFHHRFSIQKIYSRPNGLLRCMYRPGSRPLHPFEFLFKVFTNLGDQSRMERVYRSRENSGRKFMRSIFYKPAKSCVASSSSLLASRYLSSFGSVPFAICNHSVSRCAMRC